VFFLISYNFFVGLSIGPQRKEKQIVGNAGFVF